MSRDRTALILTLAVAALAASGCGESATAPAPTRSLAAAAPLLSSAPFPVWHQGFNHGTEGWYGYGDGWCGTVSYHARGGGPVAPSAGAGYATLEAGGCVAAYSVFAPTGPYSIGAGTWRRFPASGFVDRLDIYLDPASSPPTAFRLMDLFFDDAGGYPGGAQVAVGPSAGGLEVTVGGAAYTVTEAGWYTFRFRFHDADGALLADFQLADRTGGALLTERGLPTGATTAPLVGVETWFAEIGERLELPIDEHVMRPGGF